MTEWFEQWFGEEYLRLYPHRDDHDAQDAVALIDRVTPLAGRLLLDLGCGPGRHAAQLAARGARSVGLDLSLPLLSLARARTHGIVPLVRADMRHLPFRPRSFDVIVNLFTSFGYFADDAQHAAVIADARTMLRPGGTFVLDYLNATAVRDTLVPHEERTVGSQHIIIERRISDDGRHVLKEVQLPNDGRASVERVRLFTPDELEALLDAAGIVIQHRFGDYHGEPAGPAAPRLILIGAVP